MRWTHPFLHRPVPDVMALVVALALRRRHADHRVGHRSRKERVPYLYGADERGRPVLIKPVSRAKPATIVANLPPCVIGMEVCSTSHTGPGVFRALGHEVGLIHPNFVRPYVNGNKNDELDAEAICEATTQPDMRFVPVKTIQPRRPGAPSCA